MHCCARNIERLTRIPKLRTDLQSRFVACSFHPLKSAIYELAIWPGPLLAVLSAINNDCAFVQKIVVTLQLGETELRSRMASKSCSTSASSITTIFSEARSFSSCAVRSHAGRWLRQLDE